MLPTLSRYVLREVLKMYGAGLALLFLLQMTDTLASTVSKAITYRISLGEAAAAFLAILPTIVNRALVLAVPFAILLGLSRLQRDSELKATLAAGIRPLQLVWPLLLPFAAVGALAYWNASNLVPAGLERWDRTWYGVFGMEAPIPSREKYTYAPPGALYYAGRVTATSAGGSAQTPRRADLDGVMVQQGETVYTASKGYWDGDAQSWTLESPWITRPGQPPVQQTGPLVLPQRDTLRPPPPEPKKVSSAQLRAELAGGTLTPEGQREYRYHLAARYADPFTPIAFALAAAALGLMLRNQAAAMAAVIVFISGFYVVWVTMPQLAKAGAVAPTLAAWVPSLIFLLLGLGLAWRVNR